MFKSLSSKIVVIMAAGVLLLILVGVGSLVTLKRYEDAANTRTVTYQVTTLLERLLSELKLAESGQRGYLLTGDDTHLAVYQVAVNAVPDTLREIKSTTLDSDVMARLAQLDKPINGKLEELAETLRLYSTGQEEESLTLVRSGKGLRLMTEIRGIISEINSREEFLLKQRNEQLRTAKTLNTLWLGSAILLAVVLKLAALYIIQKETRERKIAQQIAVAANEKSQVQLRLLNSHHESVSMLSRLTTLLHSCNTQEEAAAAIAQYGGRIFAGTSGAVYAYNASRDLVEEVVTWGETVKSQDHFSPEQCWGLRTGQDYGASRKNEGLRCAHMQDATTDYLCLPMLAQGDAIGLFHIEGLDSVNDEDREYLMQVASTTADVIAPALVNLRLRETLKQQSIKDPLTGLYNRRFMEESFSREIGSAERRKTYVAAVMVDLDHFKQLNDTYGHEGGDAVLAAVGRMLMNSTRTEDICCRYGGEELAVILPGMDLGEAMHRVEDLRQRLENLLVHVNGKELQVTASFGVAVYPDHGSNAEQVVRAADHALYGAKRDGRNRVCSAPPVVGKA